MSASPEQPARYGMVHGRFQPFHLGHLEYTLKALACSQTLIVGITNPTPPRSPKRTPASTATSSARTRSRSSSASS